MRARIKMTQDHPPYVKGQTFNTSKETAKEFVDLDVAEEVKMLPRESDAPKPKKGMG